MSTSNLNRGATTPGTNSGSFAPSTHADDPTVTLAGPATDALDDDSMIEAYVAEHGYADVDDWMSDSDYRRNEDGVWVDEYGNEVDPDSALTTAIESSGYEPSPAVARLASENVRLRREQAAFAALVQSPEERSLADIRKGITREHPTAVKVNFSDEGIGSASITSVELEDGSVVDWDDEFNDPDYETATELGDYVGWVGDATKEYRSVDLRSGQLERARRR